MTGAVAHPSRPKIVSCPDVETLAPEGSRRRAQRHVSDISLTWTDETEVPGPKLSHHIAAPSTVSERGKPWEGSVALAGNPPARHHLEAPGANKYHDGWLA